MSKCPGCGEDHEVDGIDGDIVRERIFREVIAAFPDEEKEAVEQKLLTLEQVCMVSGINVIDYVMLLVDKAPMFPDQSDAEFIFALRVYRKMMDVVEDMVFELPSPDDDFSPVNN